MLGDRYGRHVQSLTGIWRAHLGHDFRNRKQERERARRYEPQSACFGTALARAARPGEGNPSVCVAQRPGYRRNHPVR